MGNLIISDLYLIQIYKRHQRITSTIPMATLNHHITSFDLLDSLIIESIKTIRLNKKRPDESAIFSYLKKEQLNIFVEKTDIDNKLAMLLDKGEILNKPFQGKNSYFVKTIEEVKNSTGIEEETPNNRQNFSITLNDSQNVSPSLEQLESFIDTTFKSISTMCTAPLLKSNTSSPTVKTESLESSK